MALGGARRLDLGATGEHAAEADRSQDDGHVHLLPEDRRRERSVGYVVQDALAKADRVQGLAVGAHRRLGEGATVDVVEDLARQSTSSERAIVVERGRGEVEAPLWA